MKTADYFDSVAGFWDDDFADSRPARFLAASLSIPRSGAYVLDVGCGCGTMFPELLECGASEIEGIDISSKMAEIAGIKYAFDPRIHVQHGDFLSLHQGGFDAITAFHSYHLFTDRGAYLKQAHRILREGGRLTVAFAHDHKHFNDIAVSLPEAIWRPLLPAMEEAAYWSDLFRVDCLCETEEIYLISGTAITTELE